MATPLDMFVTASSSDSRSDMQEALVALSASANMRTLPNAHSMPILTASPFPPFCSHLMTFKLHFLSFPIFKAT